MNFTSPIALSPAMPADMLDIPPALLAKPGFMHTIIRAKIAALQAMLPVEPVIAYSGPVTMAAKRKAATKKAAAMSGPEFWDRASAAYRAVRAAHGDGWQYRVTAVWGSLPTRLRSFKSERGVPVRYMRDHRFPPAAFWPGGVMPEGPEYRVAEMVRYSGPETVWLCPIDGKPVVEPIVRRVKGELQEYHDAPVNSGIAFHWPAELDTWLAVRDQQAADKAWRAAKQRAAEEARAEEIAAILFPANDDAMQLAEAAD